MRYEKIDSYLKIFKSLQLFRQFKSNILQLAAT